MFEKFIFLSFVEVVNGRNRQAHKPVRSWFARRNDKQRWCQVELTLSAQLPFAVSEFGGQDVQAGNVKSS